MTAGEEKSQPVVVDRAEWGGSVDIHHEQRLPVLVVTFVLATDAVDRLAIRGHRDPGARVRRHTVRRPAFHRGCECLGSGLLGDIEIAESFGQRGDHPRPLVLVGAGDRVAHTSRNGRTSRNRPGHRRSLKSDTACGSAPCRLRAARSEPPFTCTTNHSRAIRQRARRMFGSVDAGDRTRRDQSAWCVQHQNLPH